MKKAIFVFLSVCILFSLSQAIRAEAAEHDFNRNYGNWIGYENEDGTFTVTGCRSYTEYFRDGTLQIPSEIEGMTVTGLDLYNDDSPFHIFEHSWDIETLILPDTLINVPDDDDTSTHVFDTYSYLKKLVLPNNDDFDSSKVSALFNYFQTFKELKEIECRDESQIKWFFDYEDRAPNVEIITFHRNDEDVVMSGKNMNNLKEIRFLSPTLTIDLYGFEQMPTLNLQSTSLFELSLSRMANVTELDLTGMSIMKLDINRMQSLHTLKIPASVIALYLSECPVLSTLSSPKDVKDISLEELSDCPMLDYPVAYLNAYSFALGSKQETSYTYLMDTQRVSLSGNPRYTNSRIRELHIDSSRIAEGADKETFRNMPALEKFVIHGDQSKYYTRDGVLYWGNYMYENRDGETRYANDLVAYPAAKSTTGTLQLPENTTCIYAYALDGCKFSSVTIPENIHKDYYWDIIYDQNGEHYLYDFYAGKLRMVRGSQADYTLFPPDLPCVEYYDGSTYKIEYELNGGTNNPENPDSYVAGHIVTLSDPTREGYTFLYWTRSDYADTEYSSHYCDDTARYEYFTDLTFIAQWEKDEESAGVPGDLDGDGVVSPSDARLALRASVGLEHLSDAEIALADVDRDGAVTAADARLILRRSVGLVDPEYQAA